MRRLIPIFVLIAACAGAQTPDERRCELAGLHGLDWDECAVVPPPPPLCPNGVIDTGEACDGVELGGQTCVSQGFDSGALACAADCLRFDTSGCANDPPPPPPGGVYDLLATHLPPAGEWAQLPGSEIDVLVGSSEFPFCADIRCFNSYKAFTAWGGMAFDVATGRWMLFSGGGHTDYGGNEGYQFDFSTLTWTRLWNPAPLDGPFIKGASCQVQSAAPYASHIYDGALYIPSTDEYLFSAYLPYCLPGTGVGPGAGGLYVYSFASQSWTTLAAPDTTDTRFGVTAYDAERDRVYIINKGTLRELDPQNGYAEVQRKTGMNSNWGSGLMYGREFFWTDHNLGIYRVNIALDGTIGAREKVIDTTRYKDVMGTPKALAIAPNGDLLLWRGAKRLYRIPQATIDVSDTTQTVLEDLSNAPGPGDDSETSGIYSKWAYVPAVDAFVGIRDPRDGIFIYRLPATQTGDNFMERCFDANVVLCDPLGTEGPFVNGVVALNEDGSKGIPDQSWSSRWRGTTGTAEYDSAMEALRVTIASNSGSGNGVFATNFSDDYSVEFGTGDSFFIQYRWMASCDLIYFNCDPTSPSYKTTRRFYTTIKGGKTGFKLSIVGTGNVNQSCTPLELVINHSSDHFISGYHHCGLFIGYGKSLGGGQEEFQPGGNFSCLFNLPPDGRKRKWGDTGPDCFYLEADEWMTFQLGVDINDWDDEHIRVWAAREGQPQQLVISNDMRLQQRDGQAYGQVWLLSFMTNKSPEETHPEAYVWYDELIVSREFIGDPS